MRNAWKHGIVGAKAALLATALFLAASTLVEAQAARVDIGKTSSARFEFDHTGQDLQNQPIVVDAAEFVFRQTGIAPIRSVVSHSVLAGPNSIGVAAVLGAVPDGDYDVTVRVRGAVANNWSDESPVLQVRISSKKPQAPTNFGVSG